MEEIYNIYAMKRALDDFLSHSHQIKVKASSGNFELEGVGVKNGFLELNCFADENSIIKLKTKPERMLKDEGFATIESALKIKKDVYLPEDRKIITPYPILIYHKSSRNAQERLEKLI